MCTITYLFLIKTTCNKLLENNLWITTSNLVISLWFIKIFYKKIFFQKANTFPGPSFHGKKPSICPIWSIWLVKRPYVNKTGVLHFSICDISLNQSIYTQEAPPLVTRGKCHLYTSHIQLNCFYKLGTSSPPSGLRPFWF